MNHYKLENTSYIACCTIIFKSFIWSQKIVCFGALSRRIIKSETIEKKKIFKFTFFIKVENQKKENNLYWRYFG